MRRASLDAWLSEALLTATNCFPFLFASTPLWAHVRLHGVLPCLCFRSTPILACSQPLSSSYSLNNYTRRTTSTTVVSDALCALLGCPPCPNSSTWEPNNHITTTGVVEASGQICSRPSANSGTARVPIFIAVGAIDFHQRTIHARVRGQLSRGVLTALRGVSRGRCQSDRPSLRVVGGELYPGFL